MAGVRAADAIRQAYERPEGQDVAELLMLCETDDFKRAAMVEALRRLVGDKLSPGSAE